MDLPLYFVVFILLALIRNASAHCWFKDLDVDEIGDCTFKTDKTDMGLIIIPPCNITQATLQIQNTTVETFSKDFYDKTNFDYFIISVKATDNDWTTIAPQAFTFIYCTHIDLSNNGIKFIYNNAFLNLLFLTELNLSRNAIEVLDPQSLAVSDDPLNRFPNNVSVLDLSHNLLSHIPSEALRYLTQLRRLYLDCNKLAFLTDDTFMTLKHLIVLSLSFNQLITLQTTLGSLKKLEELNLSFNNLSHLHDYEITNATSLKTINVSHNYLEIVDINAFNSITNLQTLDLSDNKISSPISIINNTKLKHLNLSHNRIAIVDDVFANSTDNLKSVDLSSNNISVIPAGLFNSAENLKLLNLSSNFLSSLSDGSLIGLINVVVLDLSKNELLEIDASSFKECINLNKLILDFNIIKKIDFDQLTSLVPKLSTLSIGSNQILCKDVSEYYTKGLKRGVNVTSIDKVFDDDNVFGISCDALKSTDTTSTKEVTFFAEALTWTSLMVLFIIVLMTAGVWSAVTNRPKSPPPIALTNFSDVMEMSDMEQQSSL